MAYNSIYSLTGLSVDYICATEEHKMVLDAKRDVSKRLSNRVNWTLSCCSIEQRPTPQRKTQTLAAICSDGTEVYLDENNIGTIVERSEICIA